MKKAHATLLLLWVLTLCACSAEDPQPVSVTEIYNREFVKEFGVPAAGHDFSMATTAGLKVSSVNGGHVVVTAEIDGINYLFADFNAPAGTFSVPVTIPRDVKELTVATDHGSRTVATNAIVNLDEIKNNERHFSAPENSDDNPILAFKRSELNTYLEKVTQNISSLYNSVYLTINSRFLNRNNKGYLFPIYWRTDKDNHKDYKIQISTSLLAENNDVISKDINFDNSATASNPFPALKYSTSCNTVDDLSHETIFLGGTEDCDEAYSLNESSDKMIVSRGIRIEDYLKNDELKRFYKWFLEVKYNFKGESDYSLISESPYRNIAFWNGAYYDMPLKWLNTSHHGAITGSIQNAYVYDPKLKDSKSDGKFEHITKSAMVLGFSTAPKTPAAKDLRDYCDLIFLFIPDSGNSSASISTSHTYLWTIAAEDLGGTDDWDFNDAVFTFSDQIKNLNTENTRATSGRASDWGPRDAEPVRILTVTPKAAGGTMPIYITYTGKVAKVPDIPTGKDETADIMYSTANQAIKDYAAALDSQDETTYIVGKELHAWLGAESYSKITNTGAKNEDIKATPVQFAIPSDTELGAKPYIFNVQDGSLLASTKNKTICGFAVLVDKNNKLRIDAMNDEEKGMHRADNLVLGKDEYVIGRPDYNAGELAPQMILVTGNWYWPQERVNISHAYPDFASWLSNPEGLNWRNNYIKEKVTY